MPANEPAVSVVIPCYNEVGTLQELHDQIRAQFVKLKMRAEIIFIDDGSNDGSRELLRTLAAADADCRVIMFRRNCNKASALQVGFQAARGEYVITMDADLQDDPQEIPRFLEALQRSDVVSGWKATRHDPIGKTLPSKLFNATVRKVTGVKLHDMNCGFKGYRRQVVREVTLYGELHRYIPALAAARGFSVEELAVTHHPRRAGVSKYGWERFIRGFMDLVTVVYLTRYRFRPLHMFGGVGLGVFICGFLLALILCAGGEFFKQSTWSNLLYIIATAAIILGPVGVAFGLLAEGMLATTFHQFAPPPISEHLNFINDEVTHAG